MTALRKEIKRSIERCVRQHAANDALLYLFGSFARGDADRGSDIDLALDIGSGTFADVSALLLGDLERDVPTVRSFDLVDLKTAAPSLRDKIAKEGIRWL